MKKTGILAGMLAVTLLAGCSGGAPGGDLVAASDDIAYQAADIQRGAELLTVDGEPVTAERYLFWLANAVGSAQQYGQLPDDAAWDQELEEGMTVRDALKADALETAKLYRVIETKAAEYGVSLTAEEEEELKSQIDGVVQELGGDEAYQNELDGMCISREGFTDMNRVYYLNRGIQKKLEESGELTVTQAERDEFREKYIEENGLYAAKHILVSTRHTNADGSYEEFTEEERAAALEKVQDLRRQLRDAGDSEELFDQLMNEHSEDGRDGDNKLYYPEGYGLVYKGQMVPEFEAGALELEVGEIGEPVQTDYGYHLILRIPLDEKALNSEVEANCNTDVKMQELTMTWLDEAKVVTTTAYDELDPKAFFERLTAITEAREEAGATPAPTESPAA